MSGVKMSAARHVMGCLGVTTVRSEKTGHARGDGEGDVRVVGNCYQTTKS